MYDQFESLLEPIDFRISPRDLESLHAVVDKNVSDGSLINPREQITLVSQILAVGHSIALAQTYGLKPEIPLSATERFRYGINCSDVALATIKACAAVGLSNVYARFDGTHVDTIIPADDSACWELNSVKPRLLHKNNELAKNPWKSTVLPPQKPLGKHRAILFVRPDEESPHLAHFVQDTTQSLREASKEIIFNGEHSIIQTGNFILLAGDTACKTLRALDVLRALRGIVKKNPQHQTVWNEATKQLNPHIPVLGIANMIDNVQ